MLPRFLALSIFVLVILLAMTLKGISIPKGFDSRLLQRAIFPAFVLFLTISCLSLVKAINLVEGLFEWLKLFLFAAFFYAAVFIISSDRNGLTLLIRGIIILAMVLSVLGICQYYRLAFTSIPGNYVIYATMAHKNLYASALFLTLPFALYGTCRFSGLWRLAGRVAITSVFIGIALARARSVWAAFIVSTFVVGVMIIIKHRESILLGWKRGFRFNRSKSFGGLLLLFTLTILLGFFKTNFVNTIPPTGKNKLSATQLTPYAESITCPSTLQERLFIWKKSLAMAKDNLLFGVGLGHWRLVFPAYGKIQKYRQSDDGMAEIYFQRPHNDFIWILTETGIFGLISYLAIFGIALFYVLKIFFQSDDAAKRALAIFMLFGIIGYIVISFFSFPKERIVHNMLLMLNLACIVCAYQRSFPFKKKSGCAKMLLVNSIALPILILCVFVGYIRLDSETHVRKALVARKAENWKNLISEIDKADSLFYPLDSVSLPLAWYRGIAYYSAGKFQESHRDFKKAYQIHPNHIHVLNNLGTSYAQMGAYDKAIEYYKKALDVWPGFAEARINLGVIYFHMGDFIMARRFFLRVDHDHGDVRVPIYLHLIENGTS